MRVRKYRGSQMRLPKSVEFVGNYLSILINHVFVIVTVKIENQQFQETISTTLEPILRLSQVMFSKYSVNTS